MKAPEAPAPDSRLTKATAGLLGAGLLVRLALVWCGGQYFWPDESRYLAARDAFAGMKQGGVWAGITSLLAQGDHVGFKLLSLGPAALERLAGTQDLRLAAACFTLFSWTGLVWLWLWARRLGASPRAQFWVVLLAVTSTSLTFYTRHLLPYDPSLALALAALWVGAKERAGAGRLLLAGALTGAAALVYFGYWLLAAVTLVLLGLGQNETWGRRLQRGALAGAGFAGGLLAAWLADRLGQGTMIERARNFSGTVTQGDFGWGWRLTWEYFWQAEGVLVLAWLVTAGWAVRWWWRERRGLAPAWGIGLLALGLVYGGLVLTSDVVHKFVVYGRSARQLAPFFCLVSGLVLAEWLARRPRGWAVAVAGALVANFAWHAGPLFTQMFADEFRELAARELAKAPPAEPGRTYYRLVNVDHYLFEPETLPQPPEAVLLARRHPYEFAPFLYEGSSAEMRARRRAADHRMRLVRMRVPEAWQVQGEPAGQVTMKVRFAPGRGGMAEPLLSLGPPGQGNLFFVRYLDHRWLVLTMESVGDLLLSSAPLAYEAGREYTLTFFCGSMVKLPASATDPVGEAQRLYYTNLVSVWMEGHEVINGLAAPHVVRGDEVYAGYNFVRAGSAGLAFSGEIHEVRRGGLPALPAGGLGSADCGAMRLVVWLPAAAAGTPEPLVVVGVPNHAALGYVRMLPGGKAKLGTEIWGIGAYESAELEAPPDTATEIIYQFPALYPPVGDPRWGAVPREEQVARRSRVTLRFNGRVVLDQEVMEKPVPPVPVAFGRNPVGGSWVGEKFTGRLLQGMRLPLTEPANPSH